MFISVNTRSQRFAASSVLTLACVLVRCQVATAQQPDAWTGQQCLAKSPDAVVRQGDRVAGTARQLDPIFRVTEARSGWLGVNSALVSGWMAAGDVVRLDQAVSYFTDQIRSHPTDVAAYTGRGIAWRALGQYQRAVDDQNEAIRLDPKSAAAYANRGNAYAHLGRHDLAMADYEQAIRLNPELLAAHNNLAWSLATRPEREFRDGVRAVTAATKACQLTQWANPECLDTLAAAYAEAGDFEQATRWESQAIALLAPHGSEVFQSRLVLYQARRPYRHLTSHPQPGATVSR